MKRLASLATLLCGLATANHAAPLTLALPPTAEPLREQDRRFATMLLPTGPAQGDRVPARAVEGQIWWRSWRIVGSQTTLDVFAPLRAALLDQGFHVEYSCAARACGGFEFRFGIETIPAPDMMVHLSDYEFLSASRAADGVALSLLVSRSGEAVFVQAIERQPRATVSPPDQTDSTAPTAAPEAGAEDAPQTAPEQTGEVTTEEDPSQADGLARLGQNLRDHGHAVLPGVEFQSGSAVLTSEEIPSLAALATLLRERPEWRVMIVGHTDTVGSLQANIDLSRRRAEAVRQHLRGVEGLDSARFEVAGAGYLAPLTQNTTPEGREENRRVEVVLLSR